MKAAWKQVQAADGTIGLRLMLVTSEGIIVQVDWDSVAAARFLKEGSALADAGAAGLMIANSDPASSANGQKMRPRLIGDAE